MTVQARTPTQPGELRWFSPRVISVWLKAGPVLGFYLLAIPAISMRARADDHGLPVRRDFTAVEDWLLYAGPSEWLQRVFLDWEPIRLLAVGIYFSWHALPLMAGLPLLLNRRPHQYWQLVGLMLLAYYLIQPLFYLYPLEPPWMHHAHIPRVLDLVYGRTSGSDANPHAAMPSLHVAMPLLVALWYGLRDPIGKLFVGYCSLISVTVVYTGDHYVADIAAGVAFALVVYVLVRRLGIPLLPASRTDSQAPRGGTLAQSRRRNV